MTWRSWLRRAASTMASSDPFVPFSSLSPSLLQVHWLIGYHYCLISDMAVKIRSSYEIRQTTFANTINQRTEQCNVMFDIELKIG